MALRHDTSPVYDGVVRHYLDHAASSPMRPAAREAWLEAAARAGNPSSLHTSGRAARSVLEDARESVAASLGAHPTEVIFTSGATEANNLAIKGAAQGGATAVVTSAVEHHAVLDSVRWLGSAAGGRFRVEELPVDTDARVSPAEVDYALARLSSGAVVALQSVNNETGAIQPLADVAAVCAAHGASLHVDAVQGIGHMAFDFAGGGFTSAAISAHKIGGPVGVGALLAVRGAKLAMQAHGGGQERRLRSGTVDAAGAWAFAVALAEAVGEHERSAARLAALCAPLHEAIKTAAPHAVVRSCATSADQAPHIVHAIVPGAPSEALLVALDIAGIDVSPGAACTAGVIESSHVVQAMGYSADDAASTMRLSLGWSTTQADVAAAVAALPGAIAAALSRR